MHATSQRITAIVYDGLCPLCNSAARYYRLRAAVGEILMLDMRTISREHPLMHDIAKAEINPDNGMVFCYQGLLYHGVDALHMMGLLGSEHGWFNRINCMLFRHRTAAAFCYPLFKLFRRVVLTLKRAPKY